MAGGLRAEGKPSLHERIDELLEKGTVLPLAGSVEEAALVRRLYVDLAGRIPSGEEVRSYLASEEADKRERLIGRLLASAEFDRQMALMVDLWLMERRKDAHVSAVGWRKFLTDSFKARKPLNELMREILLADGTPEKNRAAARFYLDRVFELHLVTRDTGRLFFGRDLQCAQCHDHPNVDGYLQSDYYGLFAYFSRSALFHPDTKKPSLLTERASGDPNFLSVFTGVKGEIGPRLPSGEKLVKEPTFEAGKEYKVAPNPKDKNVRAIPNYSRREQLALRGTDGSNDAFNRNAANRLWAHMMGRGLVEPLDMHHADNPPSHPELLDLLTAALVEQKFDVRFFLRELALTDLYARTFEVPGIGLKELAVSDREHKVADLNARVAEAKKAYRKERDAWETAMKERSNVADALVAARKAEATAAAARKKAEEPLVKVRAARDALKAKYDPLAKAVAAAEVAMKTAPDDQELAAAVAILKKRRDALQPQLAKEEKALLGQEAGAQATVQKHEEAMNVVAKRVEEERKAAAAVESLEQAVEATRQEFEEMREEELLAKARLEEARLLVSIRADRLAVEEVEKQIAQRGSEVAQREAEEAAARKQAEVFQLAVKEAEHALKALGKDDEFAKAVEVLRTRREGAEKAAVAAKYALQTQFVLLHEAEDVRKKVAGRLAQSKKELAERSGKVFAVGVFTQMNPEVLFQSMLYATGEWEVVQSRIVAEFEQKLAAGQKQPAKEEKEDPKKKPEPKLTEADRSRYLEEQTAVKLKTGYTRFVKLFGGQAGQPQTVFYATADQALFLENDHGIRGWLRPNRTNLVGRLAKLESAEEIADELYLSILSRLPQAEEKAKMVSFLSEAEEPNDKSTVIQDLAWALLTSVEFRFRH